MLAKVQGQMFRGQAPMSSTASVICSNRLLTMPDVGILSLMVLVTAHAEQNGLSQSSSEHVLKS